MTPYPSDFPCDAAQIVLEHDAGTGGHTCCDARLACWNVCGYLQGQKDCCCPDDGCEESKKKCEAHQKACPKKVTTKAEAMACLKSLCECHQKKAALDPSQFDWNGLVAFLVTLLEQLFGGKTPAA